MDIKKNCIMIFLDISKALGEGTMTIKALTIY